MWLQDVSLIDPQPQTQRATGHHALMLPFFPRCVLAGDLRGLFAAQNNTSRQTPYFRQFPTVRRHHVLPHVRHHPDHSTCSDQTSFVLNIRGEACWAVLGRRNVLASLNVARHRNHRPLTAHQKLLLILFPDPWATFVALRRRRYAHMCVTSACEWEVAVSLVNASSKVCSRFCFWCRHQIAPYLLLLTKWDINGQSDQAAIWSR
jgi:hypothetical protein